MHWLTTPQMAALLDMHPKTLLTYAKARRIAPEYLMVLPSGRMRWRADFAEHPVFLAVPISPEQHV